MQVEELRTAFVGRDTTVREELDGLDESALPELMNLRERHTGIPGVIFISTRMGPHGPRVKYYPGRADDAQPSMSVSVAEEPRIVANSLNERDASRHLDEVIAWVRLNRVALLDWWNERGGLDPEEIAAYAQRFRRL